MDIDDETLAQALRAGPELLMLLHVALAVRALDARVARVESSLAAKESTDARA